MSRTEFAPSEFVRRIQEADEVEVRGSLYVKDAGTMFVMDPNTPERADWGLPKLPLMVICHRSRADEVRAAVEGLREETLSAAKLTGLAFSLKLTEPQTPSPNSEVPRP